MMEAMSSMETELFDDSVDFDKASAEAAAEGPESAAEGSEVTETKEKKAKPSAKVVKEKPTGKHKIALDFKDDEEAFSNFEALYIKANTKNIGHEITREMLVKRALQSITPEIVLEMQKQSLSETEIDFILRSHITTSYQN
jgi:hypothetical protein